MGRPCVRASRSPLPYVFLVLAAVGACLVAPAPAAAGERDLLVITSVELEPALAVWRAHREKQGLKITVEHFARPIDAAACTAEQTRLVARVRELAPAWILIAGNVAHVPAFSCIEAKLGRTCESDQPYALPDPETGLPAVMLGRVAAADKKELAAALAKVVRHETTFHPGEARNTIQFLAGTGGYGKTVDAVIESVATNLLSKQLAQHYRLGVIYISPASPFFVPPGELAKRTRAAFETGSLIVVYAGHGNDRSFAPLWHHGLHDYLSVRGAKGLKSRAGYPLFFSITCRTGDFEHADKPGLCAALQLEPGGPVAAFGSSENSQPLPNLLIQQGLLEHLANGDTRTVGEAVARMRADFRDREHRLGRFLDRMVQGKVDHAARKRHHQYLYNLFGDPATQLRFPARDLGLTVTEKPGGVVVLTGRSPSVKNGTALVRFDIPRNKLRGRVERHEALKDRAAADAVIRRNHEMASNKTLLEVETPIVDGRFEVTIDRGKAVPERLLRRGPIPLWFRVYAWNDSRDAVGSAEYRMPEPAPAAPRHQPAPMGR